MPKQAKTQAAVIAALAESADMNKVSVKLFFDALAGLARRELLAAGKFTIPGIARLKLVKRPARKARPGRNPATGETIMLKAKPAGKAVKATPVSAFKQDVLG